MASLPDQFKDYIKQPGKRAELADALDIHISATYQWKYIPIKRVPDVERVTGIPRHVLRPDFFGAAA